MGDSKLNWISALRDSLIGSPSDRRREERRYLKLPIEVRVASGTTYPGFSRDLSRSSMGAVVSTPLKVGQHVWVSFDYPAAGQSSARTVEQEATVRQCLGFRYGFEFTVPLDM